VRAKLTPFESRDATSEQIEAEVKRRREEDRARLMNMVAKKVQASAF